MRQNAVSSAPQNEEPIQTLATSAMIPKLVEDRRTLSRALVSVSSVAVGKSCCRSRKMLRSSSSDSSTRPAMNRASNASGKTESSRL
jgi:hypothetical protein